MHLILCLCVSLLLLLLHVCNSILTLSHLLSLVLFSLLALLLGYILQNLCFLLQTYPQLIPLLLLVLLFLLCFCLYIVPLLLFVVGSSRLLLLALLLSLIHIFQQFANFRVAHIQEVGQKDNVAFPFGQSVKGFGKQFLFDE